jgi:hypothetical protein
VEDRYDGRNIALRMNTRWVNDPDGYSQQVTPDDPDRPS